MVEIATKPTDDQKPAATPEGSKPTDPPDDDGTAPELADAPDVDGDSDTFGINTDGSLDPDFAVPVDPNVGEPAVDPADSEGTPGEPQGDLPNDDDIDPEPTDDKEPESVTLEFEEDGVTFKELFLGKYKTVGDAMNGLAHAQEFIATTHGQRVKAGGKNVETFAEELAALVSAGKGDEALTFIQSKITGEKKKSLDDAIEMNADSDGWFRKKLKQHLQEAAQQDRATGQYNEILVKRYGKDVVNSVAGVRARELLKKQYLPHIDADGNEVQPIGNIEEMFIRAQLWTGRMARKKSGVTSKKKTQPAVSMPRDGQREPEAPKPNTMTEAEQVEGYEQYLDNLD